MCKYHYLFYHYFNYPAIRNNFKTNFYLSFIMNQEENDQEDNAHDKQIPT